ncbi:sphingolipid c9-methyltransferase [Apiospora rasikravindrae]|uniref:Conserved oligomeric Golgi complex subunit 1 n=1 Tax=Apiospora rasikravindrae TaxID=990691 RepID=A0ABR1U9C1_9PEZI
MATPDTSNLTSSTQVFTTYTLPQIRQIHKSLHAQIDEKAARLRTQVGNSYRELLGTADTIVQMRQDMTRTQNILGEMGGRCGRTVVGGKITGLARFQGLDDAEAEMGCVARVKLLEACGLAVGKLLRGAGGAAGGRGERLVLAAKVLVLSRLLISSFGDMGELNEELRAAVEAAKKNLGSLRRRLLRGVEKVLGRISDNPEQADILKALCAYSLASSSGARDALRHFLNVRGEAMAFEFDVEEYEKTRGTENVLQGLDLYTRTLLDVQSIVPSKLSDALASLKKNPLLADESLRTLEGLKLDIYEKWCGDEVQYFTPFIRHDDLDGKQAKDMLTNWAKKGGEALLEGMKKILEHMNEFKAIVDLRTNVLQHWIKDGGKAKGFDPSVMLDGLRDTINNRLLDVLDVKVSKLRLVGSEVGATLEGWRAGTSDQYNSLWSDEMLDLDMGIGSAQVTHEILSRLHGKNYTVAQAVTGYETWYRLIDDVNEVVGQLQRQRWDNDVEEIEDEETIEVRQKLLSKDDPDKINKRLNTALEQSFQQLDEELNTLWQKHMGSADSGHIAMYLLRVLRAIRSRLPKLDSTKSFGLGSVPSLQEKLAVEVGLAPLEEFSLGALARTRVTGRSLWEGEPALPTLPSPGVFKLLRDLVKSMGDAGLDLWSPSAVSLLKKTFGKQLGDAWRAALEAEDAIVKTKEPVKAKLPDEGEKGESEKEGKDGKSEGDDTPGDEKEEADKTSGAAIKETSDAGQRQDLLIQWLYDIHLLKVYLGTGETPNEELKKLADEVLKKTGLEDGASERLRKATQEYWRRTSLLFGLLV